MTIEWKLRYNGTTRLLHDWGIDGGSGVFASLTTDKVTFSVPGRNVDLARLFPYDAEGILYRNAVPVFRGKFGRPYKSADPSAEGHTYELLGPWNDLERTTYAQGHKVWNTATEEWQTVYKMRLILGQSVTGTAMTSGQVIADVIAYAANCGISIAAGSIDAGVYAPWDEVVNMRCSEVILRMAQLTPDAVGWIDYSHLVPQFNFRARANLARVSLTMGNGGTVEGCSVAPRNDRAVAAVYLQYEQSVEVDGQRRETSVIDRFPSNATGREIGALTTTVELAGVHVAHQVQHIKTAAIPADLNDLTFWKAHLPYLADERLTDLSIVSGQRVYPALTYELLEGTIQDWMTTVDSAAETITAKASYKRTNGNTILDELITLKLTVCNKPTGTYTRVASATGGEPVPVGLAAALYAALSAAQYEGSIVRSEEELSFTAGLGNRLNVTGGASEWTDMDAVVQQVNWSIETGRTSFQVGPPEHLSIQDCIELLRWLRNRKVPKNHAVRISGDSADGGLSIDIGSKQPKSDGASAAGIITRALIYHASTPILLDPAVNPPDTLYKVFQVMDAGSGALATGFDWVRAHA